MMEKHCDDYLNDPDTHPALRAYIEWFRRPAMQIAMDTGTAPKLFATYVSDDLVRNMQVSGSRVRVVMVSRFGDVGIKFSDFGKDFGYDFRCPIDDLKDFGTEP